MNRASSLLITALLLILVAKAQNSMAGGDSAASPNHKTATATVVGCLSRTGENYVITGGGPSPKQFRVVGGDILDLQGKLGHTVRVVGQLGDNDPVQNIISPYNAGTTTGAGWNTLVLQRVTQVYDNCSEAGKQYSGDHR